MTTLPLGPPPATQAARAVIPGRPVLLGRNTGDRLYRAALTGLALSLPLLLVALVVELGASAWPAITRFGFRFVWTSVWDPVAGVFGAAPRIFGTIASSLLALLFAVPLALGVAIYLTEFSPKWLRQPVAFLVELLAAIPSVVYGVWGIYVLIPFLRSYVVPPLRAVLGWTPFLQGVFYGNSLLAGGVILAIMIVPYIAAAIANEFSEATTDLYLSALFEVGLILFVITVAVNALARLMIWRVARGTAVGSRAL